MVKKIVTTGLWLAAFAMLMSSCINTNNPFEDYNNVKNKLIIKGPAGQLELTTSYSDSVGATLKIGSLIELSNLIDSVVVTIEKYNGTRDSVITFHKADFVQDTLWCSFTFAKAGSWFISSSARVHNGSERSVSGKIIILAKTFVTTIKPATISSDLDSLASFSVEITNGEGPFSYAWYHESTPISNATGVALIFSKVSYSDSGAYTCLVSDKWGDTVRTLPAHLHINNPIVNAKPHISVNGHLQILSTDICSLTVTVSDSDAGQLDTLTLVKAPSGYTFKDSLFTWAPPSGYLGLDTVRYDSLVFAAIDNGSPRAVDTFKTVIEIRAKLSMPETVKGIAAVSRINGVFSFKWKASLNADNYEIFRSKDSATGFVSIKTMNDSAFSNTIKDSAFYYYVVAKNSKYSAAPSAKIFSSSINDAPKWLSAAMKITIPENTPFSIDLSDSVKDPNGDKIYLQLVSGDPATDSLNGTIWSYTPSFTDSGTYPIKISATDGMLSSIGTIQLHVTNVNRAPYFQNARDTTISLGSTLVFTLIGKDDDGDAVTLSADTLPANATFNPTTGIFSFAPVNTQAGPNRVVFSITDGKLTTKKGITVTISNVPQPVITTQPIAHSICLGLADSFFVTATGQAPLTYAWQKNQQPITNQTSAVLKFSAVAMTDTGSYVCVVSNVGGGTSSNSVRLTVNTLSQSPTSATVSAASICSGGTDTLKVVGGVLGSGASWKWYTDRTFATAVAPANSGSPLAVTPTTTTTYYVRAEGPCGNTALACSCSVVVNTASQAPTGATASSATICSGSVDTLKAVGGSLGSNAAWKWYTDANCTVPVSGNNSGTPLVVSPSATVTYYVRAEGPCGNTAASPGFAVSVNTPSVAASSISASSSTINSGASVTLTVVGGTLGTGASWKWYTNAAGTGSAVATGSPAILSPTSTTTYYVRAEGPCGNTAMMNTTITVYVAPVITTQPAALSLNKGSSGTFTVAINSNVTPTPTYKWYKQGGTTILATTSSFLDTAKQYSDSGNYYVVIANAGGTATSNNVKLTVKDVTPPVLTLYGSLDTTILLNPSGTYVDAAGVNTLTDDRDGATLTKPTTYVSNVDLKRNGKYTSVWTASDLSGNSTSVTRNVKVIGWERLDTTTVATAQYYQLRMTKDSTLYVAAVDTVYPNGHAQVYKLVGNTLQAFGPQFSVSGYSIYDICFDVSADGQGFFIGAKAARISDGIYFAFCYKMLSGGNWQQNGQYFSDIAPNYYIDVAASSSDHQTCKFQVYDAVTDGTATLASISPVAYPYLGRKPLHSLASAANGETYYAHFQPVGAVVTKLDINGNSVSIAGDSSTGFFGSPQWGLQMAVGKTKLFVSAGRNTSGDAPFIYQYGGSTWSNIFTATGGNGLRAISLSATPDADIPYYLQSNAGEMTVKKYVGSSWVNVPALSANGQVMIAYDGMSNGTIVVGKSGVCYAATSGPGGKMYLLKCQE